MKKLTAIMVLATLAEGTISSFEAEAFFPIPAPIIGTDVANNSADLVENLNALGEQAEQLQATYEKTVEEIKSGNFGFDAIKKYKENLEKINLSRLVPQTQAAKGVGENINDPDKAAEAVENVYLNTFSEEGNHMEQAKKNRQKQIELLQMNVSSMYAHALATRVNLAKEREMPETTLDSENTREILQSNRAMSEQILKRFNDILFMEAQIAEYKATQILGVITLDSETAAERQANKPELGGNDED